MALQANLPPTYLYELFWNSRGTGSKSFPGLIGELCKKHKLDFLAILETRTGGEKARRIAKRLGFTNFEIVDAQGYSGGIWVLWNDDSWKFEILGTHDQFVHVCLDIRTQRTFFIAVYAHPNPIKQRVVWRALLDISNTVTGPWCIGGDFNATLHMHDRHSFSRTGSCVDRDFSEWVSNMNLLDMGCKGPFFTWRRNGCESRLDRILVNSDFMLTYLNASVVHLPFLKSDHHPLWLRLNSEEARPNHREVPFRFVASWTLHENFESFVRDSWNVETNWLENMA
ncbi:uncharacterized protein LOC114711105 [Neltuma alba]|uniref:uncharacterized protein LOC114711105 n=1 Tax=Neltuma alba TaxID=207710 RepID=UPI0010A4158D|nr:uncharacterized protein LOC114711105 [Prosopis alba]